MPAVQHALVVGADLSGIATATLLARRGIDVDLVGGPAGEAQHGPAANVQGNGLRVLHALGALDAAQAVGATFDSVSLRAPDGRLLGERPDIRSGGLDVPCNLGIDTQALIEILLMQAHDAGVTHDPHRAIALDADSLDAYQLVVGADGVHSAVRRQLDLPTFTGLGMTTLGAIVPRPDSLNSGELTFDNGTVLAGMFPLDDSTACAYVVVHGDVAQQPAGRFLEATAAYAGPWPDVREHLSTSRTVGTVEAIPVYSPGGDLSWGTDRMVLVGNAVHPIAPTVPQGPALALEDAWALAELVTARNAQDLPRALAEQRRTRVRTLVQASDQLARWRLDGTQGDVPSVIGKVAGELSTDPLVPMSVPNA